MKDIAMFYILLNVIIIVCFIVLCSNVNKIKKSLVSPRLNYEAYKLLGHKEKALVCLMKDFLLQNRSNLGDSEMEKYKKEFEELGFMDFESIKETNK